MIHARSDSALGMLGAKGICAILICVVMNYLLYFGNYTMGTLTVFAIGIPLLLMLLFSLNPQQYITFLIFAVVLYPKKPISIDWSGEIAADAITAVGVPVIFFVFQVLFPMLGLAGVKHFFFEKNPYRLDNTKRIAFWAGAFCVGYLIGTTNFFYATYVVQTVSIDPNTIYYAFISGLQVLLVPAVCLIRFDEKKARRFFERLAAVLLIVLGVEYLLAVTGLMPEYLKSQSMDYRHAFRSLFFGFGVFQSFHSFIAYCVMFIRYAQTKRLPYLFMCMLALFLQYNSFDRAPIAASLCFTLFMCLAVSRFRWALWMSITFLVVLVAQTGMTWYSELAISQAKAGGLFSVESLLTRSGRLLRAIDVATFFHFLGSGYNSYWWVSITEIPAMFSGTRSAEIAIFYQAISSGLHSSNPHNLLVNIAVEGGLLSVVAFLFLIVRYTWGNIKPLLRGAPLSYGAPEGVIFVIALLVFYMFQAVPEYYFMPFLVMRLYGNYGRNGYKEIF